MSTMPARRISDIEALKEGIEVYKKLNEAGVVKSVSDWNSFVQAFQQGDVATVPTGCWIAPSISAKTDQSGKWKVAPPASFGSDEKRVELFQLGRRSLVCAQQLQT